MRVMNRTVRRIISVTRKEFLHILRDARTFFLVFISPAFMLVMLSQLFTFDVDQFRLAVWDQDQTPLSRQYIAALTENDTIDLRRYLSTREELDRALLGEGVHGVLVIPPGLMEQVNRDQAGTLQVVVDGTSPSVAAQMLWQLAGRTEAFISTLSPLLEELEAQLVPIDIRTRVWYNPNLRALHSMVPGLIAVVMCMPAFSLATSLTREKEMGTLEGLIATPIRGTELMLGKLLTYMVCGLISVVLVVLVATLWFRVPFEGNFALFLLLTADFLLGVLGLSLLMSSFVASQQAATVVLFLVLFIPSIFLSGLIDPVDRTSWSAQVQAYVLPTSHYITIARGIFLKGVGLRALWPSAMAPAAMGLGSLALVVKLFSKKLG